LNKQDAKYQFQDIYLTIKNGQTIGQLMEISALTYFFAENLGIKRLSYSGSRLPHW